MNIQQEVPYICLAKWVCKLWTNYKLEVGFHQERSEGAMLCTKILSSALNWKEKEHVIGPTWNICVPDQ